MANLHHIHAPYHSSRATGTEVKTSLLQEPLLWKLLVLSALAYLVWGEKVSVVFGPVSFGAVRESSVTPGKSIKAALLDFSASTSMPSRKAPEVQVTLPPAALDNLTFAIDPGFAKRNGVQQEEVETRLAKCRDYVQRFAPVAIAEMRKFGIPASITLAQALLRSNAGESQLARDANNHFGIKCFSKKCKRGHCAHFDEESHKSFFVKYSSMWESFRAHSQFLRNTGRYANLFEHDKTDYRSWAYEMAEAGYATDEQYAEKLIATIQSLRLDQYDAR